MSTAATRTVTHGTFTIEREFPLPPARVFAAWADPKAKAQWFAAPKNLAKEVVREQDFRVGGKDGHTSREQGTRGLIDNLARMLGS